MKTFMFYVWDDAEKYHWCADTIQLAQADICEEFEIGWHDIEFIKEVVA